MEGTIIARVFTSNAFIPIADASVAFYQVENGENRLLGFRLSNYDGFTSALTVQTPPLDSADISSEGKMPYATVNILVNHSGYAPMLIRNAQVFTNVKSVQELMLVPSFDDTLQIITIPPQML